MTALSLRTLGRTLLARQHLLDRTEATPIDVVSELVGFQAQTPRDPYLALWSRIAGFDPAQLEALHRDRAVARIVAMRATIHLLTADDVVSLRNLFQPVLDPATPLLSRTEASPGRDPRRGAPRPADPHPRRARSRRGAARRRGLRSHGPAARLGA